MTSLPGSVRDTTVSTYIAVRNNYTQQCKEEERKTSGEMGLHGIFMGEDYTLRGP